MKNLIIKFPLILFALLGSVWLTSCSDLLQADNPNNLLEEDLGDPRAFNSMVNGAQSVVTRALANILMPYCDATDEMIWVGSRDAWQQLNLGNFDDINNEFTDAAFFYVAEARWWTDDVIKRGEAFDVKTIKTDDLARAYVYGAITYITIADMFDDFVISSNKQEPGPAVGPANMGSLYDKAITYLDKANALKANNFEIISLLARAHQAKSIWSKVNPVDTNNPLVSNAQAATFAAQALTIAAGADKYFKLDVVPAARPGGLPIASEVNSRLESRISDTYIIPDGKRVAAIDSGDPAKSISLKDPIDNVADPGVYKIVKDFATSVLDFDFVITSSREMHLILAEDALAKGDMDGFTTYINNLRTMDKLTAYSAQIDAKALLIHERKANLLLQGRRMLDHYRFNDPAPEWLATSTAVTKSGTFFPITISEIRANPNLR